MLKYKFTLYYEKKQYVTSLNRNYIYYYHYIALHLAVHCPKRERKKFLAVCLEKNFSMLYIFFIFSISPIPGTFVSRLRTIICLQNLQQHVPREFTFFLSQCIFNDFVRHDLLCFYIIICCVFTTNVYKLVKKQGRYK